MPKLTKQAVERLQPRDKTYIQWCGELKGFGVRVSKTKKGVGKTYLVKFEKDHVQRKVTLGRYPEMSFTDAKQAAKDQLTPLGRGIDPDAARKAEARRKAKAPTVADFLPRWMDKKSDGKADKTKEEILQYGKQINDALGKIKLEDVRKADVKEMIEAKAKEHARASVLLLIYTKDMLQEAEDSELIELNPAASLQPKRVLSTGQKERAKVKRKRVLDDAEIDGFWNTTALRRLTHNLFKLILLTAQRPGEVAGMKIDEVDGRVWTIPAERRLKTKTANVVWLGDTALSLIDEARTLTKSHDGHLFTTGHGNSSHIQVNSLKNFLKDNAKDMRNKTDPKWGQWRAHDLRRTFVVRMQDLGFSSSDIKLITGHAEEGAFAHYSHGDSLPIKERLLKAWETEVLRLVQQRQAEK